MGEATEQFFASLPARAVEKLRGPIDGTLQINLSTGTHVEHWYVVLRDREIRVSREERSADAVWESSADLFDRLVTGNAQAVAALARNETTISGNVLLFLVFRAFLPSPPGTRDPRAVARERHTPPPIRPQSGRPG
ncbi:SCP2 sterol-binding domain-containing protein [Micromonospora sp. NPDC023956]|uniref:SCP2 sterol-binding domain-containing protein n=1 Tax=Micromonospora sp. NPDC023956 TaxID=3155722 RepID=UPI003404806F